VSEVLEVTPAIGEGLRAGASGEKLAALAVSQGMTTMLADGVRHAAAGVTTIQEIQRVLAVR
jgi:type II secretory ATPase GspE/PulE/Tfp pilus assembly ATPase PilB-like protein